MTAKGLSAADRAMVFPGVSRSPFRATEVASYVEPKTAISSGISASCEARPTGFEPVTFGFVDETALGADARNMRGF